MANNKKISETKLLYDPIYANKPDIELKGKNNTVFKILFIIVISCFVALSLFFSFNSISQDKYTYKEVENGIQLYQFCGKEDDVTLHIDFQRNEEGVPDETKPVTTVREFAMTCNEYVQFIFIGKDVETLEPNCFYYTKNLKAIFVDPENQYFTDVDGVLYNKDMTEIILYPMKHQEYDVAIEDGIAVPVDEKTAEEFIAAFDEKYGTEDPNDPETFLSQFDKKATFEIPDTVTKIADSCFSNCERMTNITIPDSVKEIGSLAFCKCKKLESIYIPDGVETIGSDAFSYIYNSDVEDEESDAVTLTYIYVPKSVKSIGHHAFYGDLGCEKIYMGAENEDAVETGEHWLPRQGTRSLKDVEVVYGQERGNK